MLMVSTLGKYEALLSGVVIDLSHFPHGTVEQFIDGAVRDYGLHEFSVRPLLVSRAMVVNRPEQSFRIAVSGKWEAEKANALNRGCLSLDSIVQAESQYQAMTIAADLRKYYLRHYPGRCHRNTGESNLAGFKPAVASVYIAFFDKSGHPPRDGM